MKIYVLDAFHLSGVDYAAQHFEVVRWDDPRVKNWREDADGVMVRGTRMRAEDFARAKKLKIVGKQGVGYDNIDIEAAKKHGIPVCRTPGVNSEAVAEMAMTLGLSVARRATETDRMIRAGAKVEREKLLGVEMWQKTVGIVGMGNIGTLSARKWRGAFDAKIIGYDPYVEGWKDIPHRKVSSLEELLKEADLVTLHVPLTKETKPLIGKAELALMKKTAIVVNTARGGVVDEAALYDALEAGKLFGAGLDVWEVEPPAQDHPLLGLPNVIATPHAAGGTHDTQVRSSMQVAQQVVDVLQGKPPLAANRVA
jgi:D-3-phosphoglycerate dehydrogenase / 2-oxoglutarate reductase